MNINVQLQFNQAKELLLTETITFERKLATKFVLDLLDFYEKMKENLIAEIHSL